MNRSQLENDANLMFYLNHYFERRSCILIFGNKIIDYENRENAT